MQPHELFLMMMKKRYVLYSASITAMVALFAFSAPKSVRQQAFTLLVPDKVPFYADEISQPKPLFVSPKADTLDPLSERYDDFINSRNNNLIDLKDPQAIESQVEYDPITNNYIVTEKIGENLYRPPTYLTFDEYVKWREKKQQQEYFDRLAGVVDGKKTTAGAVDPISKFPIRTSLIERLFGGTEVTVKPQGNINITFGVFHQRTENPVLPVQLQRTTNPDFNMDINMSAQGKVGEKLNVNFNYNTQSTFDFDNQMKLNYDPKVGGNDDEILQGFEAGNVSFPLRSSLIKGVQNLFGFKTELKFGHLRTTLVASQQRSKQQTINFQGGSQMQKIDVPIDEYDENRHFFVSHWARDNFEPAMGFLPVPLSQFTITKIQVWMTNDRVIPPGETSRVRPIVAIADLAEPTPLLNGRPNPLRPIQTLPDFSKSFPPNRDFNNKPLATNESNEIYELLLAADGDSVRQNARAVRELTQLGLEQVRDFEKVNAIQLQASEFTYNDQLGFISINRNVQPDQVVAVALEYTYNGVAYKIGEFPEEVPVGDSLNQNVAYLKMVKGTTANVKLPIWDLMMKNVYSLGATQVDPNEFRLDIVYEDPGRGRKRFLDNPAYTPESLRFKPLLQVFKLDTLNLQNDPGPDGIFDFVPGLTINTRTGRIMFPVLEPFGSHLLKTIRQADPTADSATLAKQILYTQLYDSTLFRAREFQQFNRFTLLGQFKGSNASEISLGTFNLPPGSVRVSGGGRQLIEGQDYTIDYNIGKVKILNESILQSGQQVSVSFEDNSLFGFNQQTMIGARFDYQKSKHLTVGGTFMNLFERPLTQKVNFGDDPINNRVYGLDVNFDKPAPWLTRAIDRIPGINTKAESNITAAAEVALLQPGINKAINQDNETGGLFYIDDFEGSTANLPLTFPANQWMIASVPQGDISSGNEQLFPENATAYSTGEDSLVLGANRAKLSWHVTDIGFTDRAADAYNRQFDFQDIFPNRQLTPLEQSNLRSLDVTIHPTRRGPYNFDIPGGYPGYTAGLNPQGELEAPETRWAGFQRGINNSSNDFEASNVEFIEFWMLNPYINKPQGVSREGKMYIDLGYISEDILRDSRQFFESGLPTATDPLVTANTPWGSVPVLEPLVPAFANNPEDRRSQDLGLDGLNDASERQFYAKWLNVINSSNMGQGARDSLNSDPSGDNFRHYRDARFDEGGAEANAGPITRYYNFNSPEGNTPVGTNNDFVTSGTNIPDAEDLNQDNSLNESEAYYRYTINLKKTTPDNQPGALDYVTNKDLGFLVTDTVTVQNEDGTESTWYRFKVPLDWAKRQAVNGIQDFRSIRFIRVFWKGFDTQTTFRFATFELGRNQWRRFQQGLVDPTCSDATTPQGEFDVNSVSIEENAARTPFNYTIPPGIQRENTVGAFPEFLQNEQALSMTICSLPICNARAIFKPLNLDLRQYQRLKMFAHAEKVTATDDLKTGDMSVFIRLGSDFVNNYYEYELPLKISDTTGLGDGVSSREALERYTREVWKNDFNIRLGVFSEIKQQRNKENFPVGDTYEVPISESDLAFDPSQAGAKIRIKGNPNLGYLRGAMIGVMNRDTADGQLHCVEVWVNEMRLNGFNDRIGYAGTARVDIKGADFMTLSGATTYTSRGWGGIDQRIQQRQLEDVFQLDAAASIALDKFFPEKWGLRLPLYMAYSNLTRRPEYDPYDLDVKLTDKINNAATAEERRQIREAALDVTETRGFNLTNVRKERKGKPRKVPLPWNIENFTASYAYNEQDRRTPFILSDKMQQYKGGLDYQYATGIKPITPFKKLVKKDKYLKFVKEFNFNPLPETYGFSSNLERIQGTTIWRPFTSDEPLENNTYYNRRFTWDRDYDLAWGISKGLKFNFDANARSLIDEPGPQELNREVRRDSILTNLRNLGRPKNYNHTMNLTYTLPFKQIPFMEWVNVKASYVSGYSWTAASLRFQNLPSPVSGAENRNAIDLGNTLQNNSTRQINGDLNFETLYNRSKYLAKINKPAKKAGDKNKKGDKKTNASGEVELGDAPAGGGRPGDISAGGRDGKQKTDRTNKKDDKAPTPTRPGDKSATGADAPKIGPDGKPLPADVADADGKGDGKKATKKEKKPKEREPSMAERIALRPLMLLRKGRFTYSETYTAVVPGFTPETKLMGLSEGFGSPGWGFVTGLRQPDQAWLDEAGREGWITHRPELNQQVMRNFTQNIEGGLTIEPFQDFRIEVTATRQFTKNTTELYKDQRFNFELDSTDFQHRAVRDVGSFTTTFTAWNTLFDRDYNALFTRFESYLPIISARRGDLIGENDPHDDPETNPGFREGLGKFNPEVLTPAFMAAYTEKDPNTSQLDLFKSPTFPNWKLTYNGLQKLGSLSEVLASVNITHGYRSTLTVNQYTTDIFFDESRAFENKDQISQNYYARYEIPQIVINEQFQPLIGIQVKTKTDMTLNFEYKKSRQLAMSFVDFNLSETRSEGFTTDFGYRLKNVDIPFLTGNKAKKGGSSKKKKAKKPAANTPPTPPGGGGANNVHDLNIKFNMSYTNDVTIVHSFLRDQAQPSRGTNNLKISPSVDYQLNRRLALRLFMDYNSTKPVTSRSFPITTVNGGITVQFKLI
jgi:cell surface protein SprA